MFLQFTFQTLYDPAKSALIPSIVRLDQLHIAAALDAFVWALMAAVGSSVVSPPTPWATPHHHWGCRPPRN
jgi:hypothetical protein